MPIRLGSNQRAVSTSQYSCLELGRYRMSLETLFRLLLVLQVDVSEVWPKTIPVSRPVTAAVIRDAFSEAEKRLPKRLTVPELLDLGDGPMEGMEAEATLFAILRSFETKEPRFIGLLLKVLLRWKRATALQF